MHFWIKYVYESARSSSKKTWKMSTSIRLQQEYNALLHRKYETNNILTVVSLRLHGMFVCLFDFFYKTDKICFERY